MNVKLIIIIVRVVSAREWHLPSMAVCFTGGKCMSCTVGWRR